MTPTRPVLACLAALALLAGATSASAAAPGARAWLTTGDRASLLAEQPPTPSALRIPEHRRSPSTRRAPTSAPRVSAPRSPPPPPTCSPDRDAIMRARNPKHELPAGAVATFVIA